MNGGNATGRRVEAERLTGRRSCALVDMIRRGLRGIGDPDDPRAQTILATLEVRLEAICRMQAEGLDADEAFGLRAQAIDQAVSRLSSILGAGVRAVACWAICKVGTMGPSPEDRLRRAIGI